MSRPPHPLRVWMHATDRDLDDLAALARAASVKIGDTYLRHVVYGNQRPGWPLARQLAALTAGAVTPEAIYDYPYPSRASSHAKDDAA